MKRYSTMVQFLFRLPNRMLTFVATLIALHCMEYVCADDRRDFVLQGVMQRVEKLKSAEFSANGTMTVVGEGAADIPQGEIRIHGAFEDGKLRFDYGEPATVIGVKGLTDKIRSGASVSSEEAALLSQAAENAKNDPKDVVAANVETYFLQTPEKVAYWFNGHPMMFLGAPNADIPPGVRRFDINALGMYGILEFKQGLSAKSMIDSYMKTPNCEVKDLGNGLQRLEFKFSNPVNTTSWAFDVDTANGFTTTGSKLTERYVNNGKEAVPQQSKVTWKNVAAAWVPDNVSIETTGGGTTTKIDLVFAFSSVNEPLDPSLFLPESFPLPEYGGVIDNSGAKAVITRQPYQNLKREIAGPATQSRWKWLVASVVLVCTLLLLPRMFRKSKQN